MKQGESAKITDTKKEKEKDFKGSGVEGIKAPPEIVTGEDVVKMLRKKGKMI